jgi:hypothetical protein
MLKPEHKAWYLAQYPPQLWLNFVRQSLHPSSHQAHLRHQSKGKLKKKNNVHSSKPGKSPK